MVPDREAILVAGSDPEMTLIYIEELDVLTFSDLYEKLPRGMLALGVKVYAQTIAAVKAPEHDKRMKKIRAEVPRGCGRQVIRISMLAHKHETTLISNKAARVAVTDAAKGLGMLETHINSFKLYH